MKPLFALVILVISFSTSFTQQRKVPFVEYFGDNTHNWPISESKLLSTNIQDSTYLVKGKSNASPSFLSQTLIADPDQDLHYEIRITQRSGAKNMGYGLCWAADKTHQDWYTLLISSNRQYTILRKQRGQYREIKRWTKSKLVLGQGKENVITVIQRNGTQEYYINNTRIFTSKFETTRGNQAGLLFHGTMKLEVTSFAVKYDGEEEEEEPARGDE